MRQLCWIGLAAACAFAQESLVVDSNLRGALDRHLTGIAEQLWTSRAREVARIKTPEQVAARQRYIRERILSSFGGFPEKTPLNAKITGTLERDGYRVEKLVYESLPGFFVTANVYVPAKATGPFPALLGVAGHSDTGKAAPFYQAPWISMARRGVLVLAYDPPGQGERLLYYDPALGKSRVGVGTREHTMSGIQCLLSGSNFARYEIWDGIRAVDYLLTRKDVDARRIGVAGNSGGGTQSAYLAVAEPRLAVAAPSCYITSWEKLWAGPGPQDAEQNFTGFLRDGLDFPDYSIGFAPRPMKILAAIRDFFPIDGARQTYAEARRIYEVLGAGDRIDFHEYDDPHGWSKPRREATYRFLEKWLNGHDDEGVEGEITVEADRDLWATPTGQVSTSYRAETVQSLNRVEAERCHAERKAAGAKTAEELRGLVAARLGVQLPVSTPRVQRLGEVGRDGYRIEKLKLEADGGVEVPALLFVPAAGAGPRPAVLYVNAAGKAADAAPGGDMEALARTGHLVLAPDVSGWGETAGLPRPGGYTSSYQTFMRAVLVGRTMAGIEVGDLLRCFAYLKARADVDGRRISVFGKGNGGVLALYAAALEPGFAKAAGERAVSSYLAIARAPQHDGVLDIVVPGVLKDFDLPDLVRAVTPRKLWLVDPRTPMGAPLDPREAAKEYAQAAGLRILERPEGWSLEKTYADWLRD